MAFKSEEDKREYMKNYMRNYRQNNKVDGQKRGRKKKHSEPFGLVRVSYFKEVGK